MAALIMIIAGAAGGFLGWLLDKRTGQNRKPYGADSQDACETRT